ncbi:hypothetical protein CDL12_05976 [Handroanthus impetiginosus]|uniref:Uncharacterized protein n=1 Tax=Handroanthus impetiginosus TaxID=429701 RepID=A0A2G9HVI8_9LAMI|nr:hypothetical protein CDL12_05976 [Handroanthus impetiginosus]
MNSPSYSVRESEIQVFKSPSKRVYPSASSSSPDSDNNLFYTPKKSFSSVGKLEKSDKLGESSKSKRGSGKLTRKVTFKLPDEADVITFYSPKDLYGMGYS